MTEQALPLVRLAHRRRFEPQVIAQPPVTAISKIVVRAPNWIGDAVMCTPALADLRACYPEAELVLWAKPAIAELLAHVGVDGVLEYDGAGRHAGPMGKLAFVRSLRQRQFHAAVLFQNAFEAAWLSYLAGIPERWGYDTDGRGWLLSQSIPLPGGKKSIHQVLYYQTLIRELTGYMSATPPRLSSDDETVPRMSARFPELQMAPGQGVVLGFNPGSVYGTAKRWLPERYAELADKLVDYIHEAYPGAGRVRCVIVGGAGEETVAARIASGMRHQPTVLSGKTSVSELMGVIQQCVLFVTNDTGPMHVAAAFNVPLVAIFGSTDPRYTAPYGCETSVVHRPVRCAPCFLRACPIDHRCMLQISVDDVFEAAVRQLNGRLCV